MTQSIRKSAKPRNPLVAAARFRQAGPHGARPGAPRRAEREALRRELDGLCRADAARDKPPHL